MPDYHCNSFKMNTNQDNFKNLFNSINEFLFILDLNGNIVEVNNAVIQHLGYNKKELKGKSVLLVHPAEYREKAVRIIEEMVKGIREKCSIPLLSKKGLHIPVETKVYKGKWNDDDVLIGVCRNLSDITLSEEKFYKVFNNNQALMAISEIDTGVFVNVNKSFLKVLGFTKSEIIGHSSKELNLFYDYSRRDEMVNKLKAKSAIDNEHVIMRTKEGKPVDGLFSMGVIKIQNYNYLLTSVIDISSIKKAEQKLKRSLEHEKLLADISQTFLSLDNLNEKVINTLSILGNHTNVCRIYIFENKLSGSADNIQYKWFKSGVSKQIHALQDVLHKAIPLWREILKEKGKILATKTDELPESIVNVLNSQGIKSVLLFPIHVENHFYGFISFDDCNPDKVWEPEEVEFLQTISGIFSNVFERQTLQRQLKESEIRLKLAIENAETGLWDWNIKTGEVIFNDMWCNMLGYNKDEIEPNVKSWEKLVHPDDMPYVMKELNKHLEGKAAYYETTHRLLTKSGKWKWVIDKGRVVEYDSDKKPVRAIGTHVDIDKQKKIEEELRKLNVTKNRLFSIIAHDLKDPIGAMMRISEMVSEKDSMDKETLYEFLDTQKELSQSTYQLLENLLNWARYNSEQISINPTKIHLNSIIEESVANIKFKANQKGVSILTDYTDVFRVYADKEIVKLIIRNLLSNALKFNHSNGFIRIEIKEENEYLKIKISDTGIGISAENIEKILSDDQFFSTRGTDRERGTGLGLKLCRSFISQSKGEFKITSKINKGTSVTFTLPKKKSA